MDVAMSSADAPSQAPSSRRCITCKITKISFSSNFKNCSDCRDKNRQKKRVQDERARQKKKMLQEYMAMDSSDDPPTSTTSSSNLDQNRRLSDPTGLAVPKTVVTASAGVKRKAVRALHDLDKDEQRAALAVLKNGLKQTVKGNKRVVTPARITSVSGEGNEYQSARSIYEVLKSYAGQVTPENRLRFQGFHAIIAMPTIDNEKRVSMVANDLRKIARIPFDHTKPTPSYNFETMGRTLEYRCTCLGNQSTVVPAAPLPLAASKAKGTHGDLIRQARQNATMSGSVITTPRLCGGTVKITALNDGRHPLGILAQRISIVIEHPTTTPVAA